MRIYIAGSISNDPDYAEHFRRAEEHLKAQGHAVINPCKNDGFAYKDYIDMGLCELMKCDALYVLKGWTGSKGAGLELHYATVCGLDIIFENGTDWAAMTAEEGR